MLSPHRPIIWRYHLNGKGVAHAFSGDTLLSFCGKFQDSGYWQAVAAVDSVPCIVCHRLIREHLAWSDDILF